MNRYGRGRPSFDSNSEDWSAHYRLSMTLFNVVLGLVSCVKTGFSRFQSSLAVTVVGAMTEAFNLLTMKLIDKAVSFGLIANTLCKILFAKVNTALPLERLLH